jgi:Fic family protein
MDRIQITNTLMMQLFELYENKGRSFYYKELFERDDQIMARQTLEEDIHAIGQYLELKITANRLKLLSKVRRNYVPKNKDEIFLLNIKNVLTKIQAMCDEFTLRTNEVIDLTTLLYRDYETVRFNKKGSTATKTVKSFEQLSSQQQLSTLIDKYHSVRKTAKYELLMTISNFYVDFIKIEPFNKYNELTGLLLVYTMLAKEFQVCRYQSFFNIFKDYKEKFELALKQAYYDWSNGLSQTDSLVRVFVDVIKQMNVLILEKEHIYEFERKMNKTNSVEYVIYNGPSVFRKKDIRNKLPLVSESTINRTLQMLKEQGVIRPLGQGRSAQWQRLKDPKQKFSPEQLSLF